MSWIIRAMPNLDLFKPLEDRELVVVMDSSDWIYSAWYKEEAPPMPVIVDAHSDVEGAVGVYSGTMNSSDAQALLEIVITDGYEAGVIWKKAQNTKELEWWEHYEEDDE